MVLMKKLNDTNYQLIVYKSNGIVVSMILPIWYHLIWLNMKLRNLIPWI